MLFPFSILISFLSTIYIFLYSSLISATKVYREAVETKDLNHFDAAVDALGLSYKSFFIDVDVLSRACSFRLLTNDARLVVVQQNIHAILKVLFGEYHLIEYHYDYEVDPSEQSEVHINSDIDDIEIIKKRFIGYSEDKERLVVVRAVRSDHKNSLIAKYYMIDVQLLPVKILYNKMVVSGIDLYLVLRMFPHIISSYEADFKILSPEVSNLTNYMNSLVKEFIWKHCQEKGEKIEQPSVSIMEHLAEEFFKENLDAFLCIVRSGSNEYLCAHTIGKSLAIYENTNFFSIGYLKNHIKFIEQYKLPVCPIFSRRNLSDSLFYCIYNCNPNDLGEIKVNGSRKYQQEATISLIRTAIPLMRIPEDAILSAYFVFATENFLKLVLNKLKQKNDSNKIRDLEKHQGGKDISSSLMISDEKLRVFMNHFVAYLSTSPDKNLIYRKDVSDIVKMLSSEIDDFSS